MLIKHSRLLPCNALLMAFTLTVGCLLPQKSSAQFGVSPSQTSNFFNDLRSRAGQLKKSAQSAARSQDVVYDYNKGAYVSQEDQEGYQSLQQLLRSDRQISQPSVRSGSSAFAARAVGDYTTYSGQYSQALSYFAPTYTSDPFLSGKRNLMLGPVNIGLGLYQGFEYNSNIRRTATPVSDIISSTLLNVSANYRISQNNVLSITGGIGVDHYFNHPELAAYGNGSYLINVLPGSTIAFDIKAGPVNITIYDRMSLRPALNNAFVGAANNSSFGVFQNDFGIAANWQINSAWALATNYTNTISEALGSANQQFSRTMNSFHASLTYSPTATWILGTEGGVSLLRYVKPVLNDGTLVNWGAFVSVPIGKSTVIKMSGGLQNFTFKAPTVLPPAGPGDSSNLHGYYYNLSITNQLNARFSHTLTVGHESSINLASNFITADFINYGVSMVAWKGGRFSISGYYENARPSLTDLSPVPAFPGTGYKLTQFGVDVYYTHQITTKLRAGTGYHFGRADYYGVAGRDADQNGFSFDLNYALTPKAGVNLGYRYFVTNYKQSAGDSTQTRVILGLNYNF
ncbi:outer membrane beta-barrel protein [Prosthecobacter sp.]|uniref:outer membrane beta-barrel protein n=1 Tax=Prosthecobacter sp. TaxID=1965333 RepID=UPI00378397D2